MVPGLCLDLTEKKELRRLQGPAKALALIEVLRLLSSYCQVQSMLFSLFLLLRARGAQYHHVIHHDVNQ